MLNADVAVVIETVWGNSIKENELVEGSWLGHFIHEICYLQLKLKLSVEIK